VTALIFIGGIEETAEIGVTLLYKKKGKKIQDSVPKWKP
jgi:hypothetical protein